MSNYVSVTTQVSIDDLATAVGDHKDWMEFIEKIDDTVCDYDFTQAVAEKFVTLACEMKNHFPEDFDVFKKRIKSILKGVSVE